MTRYRSILVAAVLTAVAGTASYAQSAPAPTEPTPAAPAPNAGRTVLRLDLAAPLFSNLDHNFWSYQGLVFPVMLSAERQVGSSHFSLGGEVLLNGGTDYERRWGGGVQGRYYLGKRALSGVYVASALSARAVNTQRPYELTGRRVWYGGASLLVGAQVPLACQKHLILDVAAGPTLWQRLQPASAEELRRREFGYETKRQYDYQPVMPDVRLNVGWRF